jgi:alpha-glucosidase (family GH31 glycosyl hydrolase)
MPSLPPFYALGWQQSADSYLTHEIADNVLAQYLAKDLPLETLWLPFGIQ